MAFRFGQILSKIAITYWTILLFRMICVKKGVGRQHTTFTSCQNVACSNTFFSFSLTGRLCSGGKRFDWSNVIFAAYFKLRGHDTHIDFLRSLFVSGCHDLPSDARVFFLWPLLKCKVLRSASWIWIIKSVNVTVSCNVLSRWAQLLSVFSRMLHSHGWWFTDPNLEEWVAA